MRRRLVWLRGLALDIAWVFGGVASKLWRTVRQKRFWIISSFGFGVAFIFLYREAVILWLIIPADGQLSPFDGRPVINDPTTPIRATFNLAIRFGFITSLPAVWVVVLKMLRTRIPFQYWWFIGVYSFVSAACFVAGAAFAYYSLLPLALPFMLGFGGDAIVPLVSLEKYLGLLMTLTFWIGLIFELPPVMFMLSTIGLIRYKRFKMLRKFWYSTAAIFAWFFSPGADFMMATMMFGSMVALYEAGMLASWLSNPSLGNYLWLGTTVRLIRRVRDGIVWFVRRPIVMIRRVRLLLRKHGLWS